MTPRKKPHRGELTAKDKNVNHDVNRARAFVENNNQHLKIYAVLDDVYRELVMIFIRLPRSYVLFPLYCIQHDKLVVLLGKLSDNKTLLMIFHVVSNFL